MKVALIGDVHANLPALEAVLAHAHGSENEQSVEAIWNVGDFVGYGAFPNEVIQRLRDEDALSIIGNYDQKVLQFKKEKKKWRKKKQPAKYLAFEWAYENLSKKNRRYLRFLSQEIRMKIKGKRILLTHGSPASEKEPLTPETPEQRLRELAQMAHADVIVCGHSHQPFAREVDGVWFINTGSVGRPDDGDPRACYAILQIEAEQIQVHHHRVEYDVERAVAAIRKHDLPEAFAQMTLQGRNLDTVLQMAEEQVPAPAPADDSPPPSRAEVEANHLQAVLQLAQHCDYDKEHTHQVTRLALKLFDELESLHHLGTEERFWLRCGALLHDIGWVEGQRKHHLAALRIILNTPLLTFNTQERLIIGSIARYHRKARPKKKHDHFSALKSDQQSIVRTLAAILRVADGLDRTHRSLVDDLACEITAEQIIVRCIVRGPAEAERQAALKKGQVLERVFRKELVIECRLI